jgi:hypothetical protein
MDQSIIRIVNGLKSHFLDSLISTDDISIFLCGGASVTEAQFRRDLGTAVAATKSKYRYSVHYPEDLFVELILGHQKQDLLTLENLLASSVSAVVILLQSPGTIAELGAFSNHPQLKNKLIVVIDPHYEKRPSFINTGPVRYLQRHTTSRVFYEVMRSEHIEDLTKRITSGAREIGMANPPRIDLTNPIACSEFYLGLIFVLDPVPKSAVLYLSTALQPEPESSVHTAAETAIVTLLNRRDVLLVSGTLSVTQKGIEALFARSRTDRRRATLRTILSEARIDALNKILRKQRRRIWGEAA